MKVVLYKSKEIYSWILAVQEEPQIATTDDDVLHVRIINDKGIITDAVVWYAGASIYKNCFTSDEYLIPPDKIYWLKQIQ